MTSALPPRGFRPAGKVVWAERTTTPPVDAERPIEARLLRGRDYEKRVRTVLAAWAERNEVFAAAFGPWYAFRSEGGPLRWCQPDVVIDPNHGHDESLPLVVLEIKLNFEPRAWFQVVQLYAPVIAKAEGRRVVGGVIAGSFDPAVQRRVPGALGVSFEPQAYLAGLTAGRALALPERLPVLQWRRPKPADVEPYPNRKEIANG